MRSAAVPSGGLTAADLAVLRLLQGRSPLARVSISRQPTKVHLPLMACAGGLPCCHKSSASQECRLVLGLAAWPTPGSGLSRGRSRHCDKEEKTSQGKGLTLLHPFFRLSTARLLASETVIETASAPCRWTHKSRISVGHLFGASRLLQYLEDTNLNNF
nr:uncharacterized protein LOC101135990 [Gorilla gorilla gorilla]